LKAFYTADTNPDVSCLNHRNIVRTIPDGKKQGLEMPFDQFDDKRLLERGYPTALSVSS
jgi:hypothetical protein